MELVHTSAPRGLKAGSRGFTTVAHTRGMPTWLSETLERLSGYRFVAESGRPDAERNPIVHRHARLVRGSESFSVLSRIAPCSADYSGRSNRIAHHLVFDAREHVEAGPAWLLGRDGLFRSAWKEEPRLLDPLRSLPDGDLNPARCRGWQEAAGDAGWAGEMLRRWLDQPDQPLYLRHAVGWEVLELLVEAAALLPPEQRWKLTFQTGVTDDLPAGITCALRCVPQLAGVRANIRGIGTHNTLDLLTRVALGDSEYAQKARRGELIETAARVSGGARKISAVASRTKETPGTAAALDEESELTDTQYELAPLDDLPLDHGPSLGPVPRAPIQAVPRRRRDLMMFASGAVAATVAIFAIAVGVKLFWPQTAGDSPEISGMIVEQTNGDTGIAKEPQGGNKRVTAAIRETARPSEDMYRPDAGPQELDRTVSTQQDSVETEPADRPEARNVAARKTPPPDAGTPEPTADVSIQQPDPEPVRWAKVEIAKDKVSHFKFDPAVIVAGEEAAELPIDWLTDERALQVAWLAAADGSQAEDVPRWEFDGDHIVKTPSPTEVAGPSEPTVPLINVVWREPPPETLRVSFRTLVEDGVFAELAGLCLRHPSGNRAILLVWRRTRLDAIDLGWVKVADEEEGRHYEGRGTVRNWVMSKKPFAQKSRSWRYEKEEAMWIATLPSGTQDKPLFRAEIDGPPDGKRQLRVFIAAKAMPKPADDDPPFIKQLRAALQPANKNKQTQRSVTLPNVYGVPMIELIFPGQKPETQPNPDDPQSSSSKEAPQQ